MTTLNYYDYIKEFRKNPKLLEKLTEKYSWEDCRVDGLTIYYKYTPRYENDCKWEPVSKKQITDVYPSLESMV